MRTYARTRTHLSVGLSARFLALAGSVRLETENWNKLFRASYCATPRRCGGQRAGGGLSPLLHSLRLRRRPPKLID